MGNNYIVAQSLPPPLKLFVTPQNISDLSLEENVLGKLECGSIQLNLFSPISGSKWVCSLDYRKCTVPNGILWNGSYYALSERFRLTLIRTLVLVACSFNCRKRLNWGTVPPDKTHPGGTVPPYKTHPGRTVPPDKTHRRDCPSR